MHVHGGLGGFEEKKEKEGPLAFGSLLLFNALQ